MRTLASIGESIDANDIKSADEFLKIAETVLEHWVCAKDEKPTEELKEGFRLLALHKQGAKADASFNACRETCRELIYHYNLITMEPEHPDTVKRMQLLALITSHLYYFIAGKLENAKLGEFCCSSKNVRATMD